MTRLAPRLPLPVQLGLLLALLLIAVSPRHAMADMLDDIRARGVLVVGVKSDYGAWGHYDAEGEIVGIEPDLAARIADALDVDLSLESVTAANRLARLEQGNVDLLIATLGDTVERRQVARILRPHYYASGVRLLAPETTPFTTWRHLRGRPVCLVRGAYYNRHMQENLMVEPMVFPTLADAKAALRDGRCVGLAYDDTILSGVAQLPEWSGYDVRLEPVETTPWGMALRREEGTARLATIIEDMIADWHRHGTLLEIEARWLPRPSPFLLESAKTWAPSANGEDRCTRGEDGAFPAACLESRIARTAAPAWTAGLAGATGFDLAPFFDQFNRTRLLSGLGNTVLMSIAAVAGGLATGALAALAMRRTQSGPRLLRPLGWIVRGIVATAQMTPPILQIYILYFGLAGWIQAQTGMRPGAFAVGALVLSGYAGATIAVLLGNAFCTRPQASLGEAFRLSYDGIEATLVNIVKAAGMVSAIAFLDIITATADLVAEGADKATMMNLLLVFYLAFVMAVMAVLSVVRRWIT